MSSFSSSSSTSFSLFGNSLNNTFNNTLHHSLLDPFPSFPMDHDNTHTLHPPPPQNDPLSPLHGDPHQHESSLNSGILLPPLSPGGLTTPKQRPRSMPYNSPFSGNFLSFPLLSSKPSSPAHSRNNSGSSFAPQGSDQGGAHSIQNHNSNFHHFNQSFSMMTPSKHQRSTELSGDFPLPPSTQHYRHSSAQHSADPSPSSLLTLFPCSNINCQDHGALRSKLNPSTSVNDQLHLLQSTCLTCEAKALKSSFPNDAALQQHVYQCHGHMYCCFGCHCSTYFSSKKQLKEHIRYTHVASSSSSSGPDFYCEDYCGRSFASQAELQRHLVLHLGVDSLHSIPKPKCEPVISSISSISLHRSNLSFNNLNSALSSALPMLDDIERAANQASHFSSSPTFDPTFSKNTHALSHGSHYNHQHGHNYHSLSEKEQRKLDKAERKRCRDIRRVERQHQKEKKQNRKEKLDRKRKREEEWANTDDSESESEENTEEEESDKSKNKAKGFSGGSKDSSGSGDSTESGSEYTDDGADASDAMTDSEATQTDDEEVKETRKKRQKSISKGNKVTKTPRKSKSSLDGSTTAPQRVRKPHGDETEYFMVSHSANSKEGFNMYLKEIEERFRQARYPVNQWVSRKRVCDDIISHFNDKFKREGMNAADLKSRLSYINAFFSAHIFRRCGKKIPQDELSKDGLFIALRLKDEIFKFGIRCNVAKKK